MNPSDLRKLILEGDDEFPPDIWRDIQASPELLALYDRTRVVRQLVNLKRHERPAADFDTRVRQDIMRSIRQKGVSGSAWARCWDVLSAPAIPVLRYGAAAAVVAILAVHVVTEPETPTSQASWSMPVKTAASAPAPVLLASTNIPKFDIHRLITVPVRGDNAPSRVQYGPLPSVPVSGDPWSDPAYGRYR